MIARLEKNLSFLLNYWKISYDQTKKGVHIDLLTTELLPNTPIYYEGWGKRWEIGEIKSKGGYIVNKDKDKKFIFNGKWYHKIKGGSEELKSQLAKFFFELGIVEKKKISWQIKKVEYQGWDYNLGKLVDRSYNLYFKQSSPIQKKSQINSTNSPLLTLSNNENQKIRGKILSLRELVIKGATYYRFNISSSPNYFLYNTYNGSKPPPFQVGETRELLIKNGNKHSFFQQLCK